MAKRIDYASMFTHRKDGRYQKVINGKTLIDKDPARLFERWQAAKVAPPVTFKTIAEDWKKYHFERISYKTSEAYTAPLRRLTDEFGNKGLDKLTAALIQAYISDLAHQDYARRTVQMHLDIMRMICDYAILQGNLQSNPTAAVEIPNGLRTDKREIPSDADIATVKKSVDVPFGLFAYFLLYTGCRRGEALPLNYEDIDFDNKIIHINKSVCFEGNAPIIKSTKSDAGNRDIILLDVLSDKLDRNGKGLIFGDNGKMLTKMQFRRRWDNYQKATGLTITAHQLRHAYATILYDAKIDDKAAQELLGHSSITVTRDVYTHIRQSRRGDTAATLNNYVNVKPRVKPRVIRRQAIDK